MKRSTWILIVWGLISVALIALLIQVGRKHDQKICREINIQISTSGEDDLISKEDIEGYILQTGDSIRGRRLETINLHGLEERISHNPYVSRVHVYITIDAILHIEVLQRKPIVRMQNLADEPFYISADGRLMPINPGCPARVLFASGHFSYDINSSYYKNLDLLKHQTNPAADSSLKTSPLYKIFRIASYIQEQPFMNAQITQLIYNKNGDFSLIPLVGNHIVILGDESDLEEKFSKLEIFYRQGLSLVGWDSYDTINLKYSNQVVCSPK